MRVVKTATQTALKPLTYAEAAAGIVASDGLSGLFFRGLTTKIVSNGIQVRRMGAVVLVLRPVLPVLSPLLRVLFRQRQWRRQQWLQMTRGGSYQRRKGASICSTTKAPPLPSFHRQCSLLCCGATLRRSLRSATRSKRMTSPRRRGKRQFFGPFCVCYNAVSKWQVTNRGVSSGEEVPPSPLV